MPPKMTKVQPARGSAAAGRDTKSAKSTASKAGLAKSASKANVLPPIKDAKGGAEKEAEQQGSTYFDGLAFAVAISKGGTILLI